jgi:hypothetical protein
MVSDLIICVPLNLNFVLNVPGLQLLDCENNLTNQLQVALDVVNPRSVKEKGDLC